MKIIFCTIMIANTTMTEINKGQEVQRQLQGSLCKNYEDTNMKKCNKCIDGYTLMVFNETSTICGLKYTDSQTKTDLCSIDQTAYPWEYAFQQTLSAVFKYYERFTQQTPYCFSCKLYFYKNDQQICNVCEQETISEDFSVWSVNERSQGCLDCIISGQDNEILSYRNEVDLQIRQCAAPGQQSQSCTYTQFYDTKSKQCKECSSQFLNCAACSQDQCTICQQHFYWNPPEYEEGSGSLKIPGMCLFNSCPLGYCRQSITEPQTCTLCEAGYLPKVPTTTGSKNTCQVLNGTTKINYFVKNGAPLLKSELAYDSAVNKGLTIGGPFYFVQEAINAVYQKQQAEYLESIDAIIFVSLGTHYFFQCDGDEVTTTFYNNKFYDLVNYCSIINLEKALQMNDKVNITIRPLYCNQGPSVGYSSTNTDFLKFCMKISTDPKPVVIVNSAKDYFNITGNFRIENLMFSGINAFTRPTNATHDYSIFPLQLCDLYGDIKVGDFPLTFQKSNQFNYVTQLSYSCKDDWYSKSTIPQNLTENRRCKENSNQQFAPFTQSTLACDGDIGSSHFFEIVTGKNVYSRRSATLFNIYAFPDHLSTLNQPPSLTIVSCDFSYFLGGYTSLINVEHNNLRRITKQNPATLFNMTVLLNMDFFVYNGANRGFKLLIQQSTFQHSRFCLGLILFRRQIYIPQMTSFLNTTYIFRSKDNTKNDIGSQLLIVDSEFTNLNYLTNTSALALYQGTTPQLSYKGENSLETLTYEATIHKGIVLNIEGFDGKIEIAGSKFRLNTHFIPELIMPPLRKNYIKNSDHFIDQFLTNELKFAICNQDSLTDEFFLAHGISMSDDIDKYFDQFERLGLIYISRNKEYTIIRQNLFQDNIGTFGGAITIDSPDWAQGNNPYLVISDNRFVTNFAYFSGNAIHFRGTLRYDQYNQICGGLQIQNSEFYHNIGMKVHNGGAISAVCEYLDEEDHDDYYHTSTFYSNDILTDNNNAITSTIQSLSDASTRFRVQSYQFTITGCNFTENYSGIKGTAIYLKYINKIRIQNSTFASSGPVYAVLEQLYSPYSAIFKSNISVTFQDLNGVCKDEFSYINNCAALDYQIDWPQVLGALYVYGCIEEQCMNSDNIQELNIINCDFVNNDAGPFIDQNSPYDLTSSMYISSNRINIIQNTTFRDHQGSQNYSVKTLSNKLFTYFPATYFIMAQAPVIRIMINLKYSNLINQNYTTTFRNSSFLRNKHVQRLGISFVKQYYGSLISLDSFYQYGMSYTPILILERCQIRENYFKGNESSLIYLFKGLLKVINTTAYGNGYLSKSTETPKVTIQGYFPYQPYISQLYQTYGLFYLMGMEQFITGNFHEFRNNVFRYNFAYEGAIYSMKLDNQFGLFQNNSYKFNVVNKQGAVIYVRNQDGRTTYKFVNEDISYQYGAGQGAISMEPHDPDFTSLLIYNSTFTNNLAKEGQSIFCDSCAYVLVSNCTFSQNSWQPNNTMYFEQQFIKQTMGILDFIDMKYLNTILDKPSKESGAIYMEQSVNTKPVYFLDELIRPVNHPYLKYSEIIDSSFHNLTALQGAAIMSGKESYLRVFNTRSNSKNLIFNNTVDQYGAIYIFRTYGFIGANLTLQQNVGLTRGSAVGASVSKINFTNCVFKENRAIEKGTFYFYEDNSLTCFQCSFLNNYAQDSSGIFALNNLEGLFHINNSEFINNTHTSNLASYILSQGIIANTLFLNNIAQQVNNGITLISSNLSTYNITVNYTDPKFLWENEYTVDAGFFNLNYQSNLRIGWYSVIQNCRGAIASAIYATGYSSIYIVEGSKIINCASFSGSSLYVSMTNEVWIYASTFSNNTQKDIQIQNADANIYWSMFNKGRGNFIRGSHANIVIQQTTFQNAENINEQGAGVYCHCDYVEIQNCLFKNLSALEGGAIYLTSSIANSTFSIINTTFDSNKAMHGGAIKIQDAFKLNISNNNFTNNQALLYQDQTSQSQKLLQKGLGGAINLDCQNEKMNLTRNCKIYISNKNIFLNNEASNDGGAIIWTSNRFIDDNSNIYTNNKAPYAKDVASFPKELVFEFISNNDYYNLIQNSNPMYQQKLTNRILVNRDLYPSNQDFIEDFEIIQEDPSKNHGRLLQSSPFKVPGIVSGTPFAFAAYILDQDGILYTTDSQSVATLKSISKGVVMQNFEVIANQGIYNFSKVTLNLEPGSLAHLNLSIEGIVQFSNQLPFIQNQPQISVQSRPCIVGEQYTQEKRCLSCKKDYYLYIAPSNFTQCQVCPPTAQCFGLSRVAPKKFYWRSSNISENIIKCPNQGACLGGSINDSIGTCADGYTGILCGNCLPGYKKSRPFLCSKCPTRTVNTVQLIGLLVVAMIICILMVRSNIRTVEKEKPLYSVYMKIITNHFQILAAITAIDYDWPHTLKTIQDGQLQFTTFTDEMFSFDCFLQDNGLVDQSDKLFLQKVLFYSFLPLIFAVTSVVVWSAVKYLYKLESIKDRLIGTIIVVMFLIHPSIARILFSAFNCIEVDGVKRLKDDLEMQCYAGKHIVYIITIILPALIIWVAGVPLIALIMMNRQKRAIMYLNKLKELTKADYNSIVKVKIMYGFLFNGFRIEMFYWEIIIIYRKILIVLCVVFFSIVSTETQILTVLFIIVISMLLQINFYPYYTKVLNRMELFSLQVNAITMYGGMFYVTGSHYNYMDSESLKYFFLLLILIPNLLFLIYWMYHMRIELLKILFVKNKTIYTYMSCNLYKDEDFERMYMSAEPDFNPYEMREDGNDKTTKQYLNNDDIDDFSNVIMKKFIEKELKNGNDERESLSESDENVLHRKPAKEIIPGSEDDDTGDSKKDGQENKLPIQEQEIRLEFPAHMLREIQQPKDGKLAKSNIKQKNSPNKSNKKSAKKQKKLQQLQSPMSRPQTSRKVMPETMANQLTQRKQFKFGEDQNTVDNESSRDKFNPQSGVSSVVPTNRFTQRKLLNSNRNEDLYDDVNHLRSNMKLDANSEDEAPSHDISHSRNQSRFDPQNQKIDPLSSDNDQFINSQKPSEKGRNLNRQELQQILRDTNANNDSKNNIEPQQDPDDQRRKKYQQAFEMTMFKAKDQNNISSREKKKSRFQNNINQDE
ncbi:UNKNOWN [Stylonychia lemnae]|uniref:DUF7630 domain-containing protein n=1 Tax=Stylonychia lemnae TaxID=5949 RepID=A0A077ZVM5_STYLE|nr:UNKNOWN [Stylonychia lemnae]|eukprot:CDW73676.1 UNKNOWN [Stylonychia lemnae]